MRNKLLKPIVIEGKDYKIVNNNRRRSVIIDYASGKEGFYDNEEKKIVLPCRYTHCEVYYNIGLFGTSLLGNATNCLINFENNKVIENFTSLSFLGRYSFIKESIDSEYTEYNEYSDNDYQPKDIRISILNDKGLYGYIDIDDNEIIPCIYEEARPFLGDLAVVKLDGKYGAINKKGEIVVPIIYFILKQSLR